MPQARVCVYHPSEETRQEIIRALQQQDPELQVVPVTDLRRAVDTVREEEAEFVVVAVESQDAPALRTIANIRAATDLAPGIMVVSEEPSRELLVACARAGFDEFVELPLQPGELADALGRLYRKRGEVEHGSGKAIAVYSPKGGVGSTTLAANLALNLAELGRSETASCVIDMSPHFGNMALVLDIREFSHSLADACRELERLDRSLLNTYLSRHESGAAVLPAPLSVGEMEDVEPSSLISVVNLCREVFDHVILDLPHSFDEFTMAGLDCADQVLLLCDMMLPTVHNTKLLVETLRELEISQSKLKLVINRYYDGDQISLQEISEHVQLPIHWVIPYDSPVAISSANSGRALHRVDEKSEIARSTVALARDLAGLGQEETEKKRRFGLFGRK